MGEPFGHPKRGRKVERWHPLYSTGNSPSVRINFSSAIEANMGMIERTRFGRMSKSEERWIEKLVLLGNSRCHPGYLALRPGSLWR